MGYSVTNERGVAMVAGGDIDIYRLARFSAIAFLMCGTTVSEGQIIINVPDGIYSESAMIYKPEPPVSYYGADLFAPDLVDKVEIRVLDEAGHAYVFEMKARTLGEGPESHASLENKALEPSGLGDQYEQAWSDSSAVVNAFTDFDFVVHNKTGTDVEYIVPLVVEGTLSAFVAHEENGTNPMLETRVRADAFIEFYECPDDWDDMPIGGYYLHLYHNYFGTVLPTSIGEKKPWLLTVPVLLGKKPGDRACFTVCSKAQASGIATTYSNKDHPELNSHSKITAVAVVDPYIYIDPTWEHADKFGIAFPDNVTPLTDPPRLLFFDSFESGDILIWSSAVPKSAQ